jgi:hypothetical protein
MFLLKTVTDWWPGVAAAMSWQYGDQCHLPGIDVPESAPDWAKERWPDLFGDQAFDSSHAHVLETRIPIVEQTRSMDQQSRAQEPAQAEPDPPTNHTPALAQSIAKLSQGELQEFKQFENVYEQAVLAIMPVEQRHLLIREIRNSQSQSADQRSSSIPGPSMARYLEDFHNPDSSLNIASDALSSWSVHSAALAEYERAVKAKLQGQLPSGTHVTDADETKAVGFAEVRRVEQAQLGAATIAKSPKSRPASTAGIATAQEAVPPATVAIMTTSPSIMENDSAEINQVEADTPFRDNRSPGLINCPRGHEQPAFGGITTSRGPFFPRHSLNGPAAQTNITMAQTQNSSSNQQDASTGECLFQATTNPGKSGTTALKADMTNNTPRNPSFLVVSAEKEPSWRRATTAPVQTSSPLPASVVAPLTEVTAAA